VVVGGDGDPTRPRQVVATASYEARAFGVRSGMPLVTAARRCPDATFLPSDKPAYEAASEQVMAALRTLPVTVEVWGWDEAFVGVTTDDPHGFAARVQATVFAATRLTCAVGIGETKLQAKTATGFAKPGGIAQLTRRTWIETMGDRPVTELWGIGTRIAARLAELGAHRVVELARADEAALAAEFGPTIGPHLKVLGLGGDDAPVTSAPHVARGRSTEETFRRDLTDLDEIGAHVARMARELTEEVVAAGRQVTHVAVKVRTATFFTRTKISKLPEPTTDPVDVARWAGSVLDRFELRRLDDRPASAVGPVRAVRPIRLLGVRVVLD
jgi:DNA polymerase-4